MLFSLNSYSVVEMRLDSVDYMVQVPEYREKRDLEELWDFYLTDECEQYNTSIENEDELRGKGLRRCLDKSVSFVQPASRGIGGWEGKCGHTFAANSFYTMCKIAVGPSEYFGPILGDITPGVRAGTLRSGLSKAFSKSGENCPDSQGHWTYLKLRNKSNYIERIKKLLIPNYSHINLQKIERLGKSYLRNPVGVLIQNPGGKYIHWVKIIDVLESQNVCKFIVNHWDNQYEVPCETMAIWSGRVGRTYPVILKSYSVVSFK
jgi:hypothetical protein